MPAGAAVAFLSVAPNLGLLIVGRLLFGLGIGFAMHAAPAYLAETAPESVRGLLIRCRPPVAQGALKPWGTAWCPFAYAALFHMGWHALTCPMCRA